MLDRRTGIPITLALLYMEVARRAGLPSKASTSPGTFCCAAGRAGRAAYAEDLIIDAVPRRRAAVADACRELLRRQAGDDDARPALDARLLPHATKPQILARMLANLKRIYVRMHSFPQARDVTDLLIAVDPSAISELRDRGLLAYHLKDFSAALRDLQAYLSCRRPATRRRRARRSTSRSGST